MISKSIDFAQQSDQTARRTLSKTTLSQMPLQTARVMMLFFLLLRETDERETTRAPEQYILSELRQQGPEHDQERTKSHTYTHTHTLTLTAEVFLVKSRQPFLGWDRRSPPPPAPEIARCVAHVRFSEHVWDDQ